MKKVSIIGAGLSGLLLAIYLRKRGFHVDMFERRPDLRDLNIEAGRSISIALSARGIRALAQVGLEEQILARAVPMYGRTMHAISGELNRQPYGVSEQAHINSISREELNIALLNAVEQFDHIDIHFEQNLEQVDFHTAELQLMDQKSNRLYSHESDVIFATDGAYSPIRAAMVEQGFADFNLERLSHGYKELTIYPEHGSQLELNALHIWPREDFMFIALPNYDGSYTCTLFLPYEGKVSFAALKTEKDIDGFFSRYFPDVKKLMPHVVKQFLENPAGHMETVKGYPWHVNGKVLLLGDAAHAMVPFLGQGLNCAFEDCSELDKCLANFSGDWGSVFEVFEKSRKENTDAIAEMSLENYLEMREKVGYPEFLLRKAVECALMEKYPDDFVSQYNLVSFHRMPYAKAQALGRIQDKILDELCSGISSLDELDWGLAEEKIRGDS